MTGKQIFEKCIRIGSEMESTKNEYLQLRLDHEIDDTTMCEGYAVFISTEFLFKCGCTEIETIDGEHPDAVIIMMEVKYEDCHPSSITFYDDDYKTPIMRYKVNDDLMNTFSMRQELTKSQWSIDLVDKIIMFHFTELMKRVIYNLVENM